MRGVVRLYQTSLIALALAACGDNIKPPVTVGGTVSGLAGAGLVLRNNGGDELAISGDGPFSFRTAVAFGGNYAVTVVAQPSSPTQTCTVARASGVINTDDPVTDVVVTCKTGFFTVGGTVSGLTGSGLVLENNGTDDLAISASGAFTFATSLASGTAFAVTVKTQPSGPTQTCTVSGGSGIVGAGSVTTVVVDCAVDRFTVGGLISGLSGTVVLRNNGGDDITVSSNGSFAFPTTVASGTAYAVTVLTQPASPISQTCTVSAGTGTVTNADITSVRVDCTTNTFTVGGNVTGLEGTGLVLQNNGGDNLAITADGSFTFATPVASGATYAVTVLSQPTARTQVCTVTNDTGTMGGANVTNVLVTCVTSSFTIGGTVSGLAGAGLVLQNNAGDNLGITANGTFTFATPIASGSTYAVTVLDQPSGPTQTCTVSGGTGTVGAGNVTSVVVDCTTNRYTVGGTISGLAGTVVLQNTGGDDLPLTANGSFAFATTAFSGTMYNVTVLTQPGTPSQTCTVTNGSGTVTNADVTSVTVTCVTNRFTIGGTVSGLNGSGLVLQNNGGDNLTISANGSFTFATSVPSGGSYSIAALSQPTSLSQTCIVGNATGVVGGANVTNVTVTCTTDTFLVGGSVTGLSGAGFVLRNNGGDNLSVNANGTFNFATRVPSGGSYAVTVFAKPMSPSQTCVVTNGSGTVTNANITNVTVTCTTDSFTIGGTVSGLAGSGLVLQNNGGDNLSITANGSFTFATPIASNTTFNVTTLAQPSGPTQSCTVSGATGTVGNGAVTSVMVNCTTTTFTVGGSISGLVGAVILQNNAGDNLSVTSNGTFAFATPVPSGNTYNVTVLTNPGSPKQTCVVSAGTGVVGGANVTSVVVTCTTDRFTVGGTLSGLAPGNSIVLRNNGADNLTVSANGTFTFATSVPSGAPYNVIVFTQPSGQSCSVSNGSGTVTNSNITTVVVTCVNLCGNNVLDAGEERDPPPGPFSSVVVDSQTCRWHFENVPQLYCNGTCTWAGAAGCDQADADIYCKLRTGSPTSVATTFQVITALPLPGFACPGFSAASVNLGPKPLRGVNVNVWYQDTSILANHGPGLVVSNANCTP
jgi:hypothetical protein